MSFWFLLRPFLNLWVKVREIRKELFSNYFFHSLFSAFSLSGDSPFFSISLVERLCLTVMICE